MRWLLQDPGRIVDQAYVVAVTWQLHESRLGFIPEASEVIIFKCEDSVSLSGVCTSDRDLKTNDIVANKSVSKEDLYGYFYVQKTGNTMWDSYYETIDALRPLFRETEFRKRVSGFYLKPDDREGAVSPVPVTILYFTSKENAHDTISILKDFFTANELCLEGSSLPHEDVVVRWYGDEDLEERFRNFLSKETQIGLELLRENRLHSQILFATYRWQVRKASLSFEEHFENTFLKYSATYRSWSDAERARFFRDLKEWPNRLQPDWAHFMVLFVLGGDWIGVFRDPQYISPGKPLSIPEINAELSGFQIPLDWKPNIP